MENNTVLLKRNHRTHFWTSKVSVVVEPVYVGPTVVKGVNELMCDDAVHVRLLVNVVLTQDNLEAQAFID